MQVPCRSWKGSPIVGLYHVLAYGPLFLLAFLSVTYHIQAQIRLLELLLVVCFARLCQRGDGYLHFLLVLTYFFLKKEITLALLNPLYFVKLPWRLT